MSWSGYIPGSLLLEMVERPKRVYRSIEGYGIPPSVEDYPFQGVEAKTTVQVEPIPRWQHQAQLGALLARVQGIPVPPGHRAGNLKHPGFTPLGTRVATLCREGNDILSSDCGYCCANIASCNCGKAKQDG